MTETIYDILRSYNIEKNVMNQKEWIKFITELELNIKARDDLIELKEQISTMRVFE